MANGAEEPLVFKTSSALSERQLVQLEDIKSRITKSWVLKTLAPIIEQHSRVSIRMMDWLCTNFSKSSNVVYPYSDGCASRMFHVFSEYNNTLDSFGRRLFDPFRRGSRIFIEFDDFTLETTVAQLVFWEWADRHHVLRYAFDHAEDIEKDMNQAHHKRDIRKASGKRKRVALSSTPRTKCFVYTHTCTLVFDSDEETERRGENEQETGKATRQQDNKTTRQQDNNATTMQQCNNIDQKYE